MKFKREKKIVPFKGQTLVLKPDGVNSRRKRTTEVRFNLRSQQRQVANPRS